ncbi:MAG: EamA family transporter [Bacteroidetes bacterium]|nr:EamA family transporter [Bacteroidota bacterium]
MSLKNNTNSSRKWIGHLAALAVYIIFGINPNCSKAIIPEYIHPEVFTEVRMLFGAAGFWLLSLFFKREKVEKKDMGLFVFGAVVLAGTLVAFAEAFRYTSPSYVSLISATSPLVVMILAAVFLKEPISIRKSAGVFVGICGALMIVLFSWKIDANAHPLGLLLCFVNILFYAAYLLITRSVSKKYSPVTMMKWMFLYGSIICAPLAIYHLSQETCPMLYHAVPVSAWLNLLTILIFATVVSYFLLPLSLKVLRPTTVSMYSNLQPVVTACVAIALGQDIFTWNKPVALVLILIGVYLVTTSRAKDDAPILDEKTIS